MADPRTDLDATRQAPDKTKRSTDTDSGRQVHEEDVASTAADAGRQAPEEDAPPADADSDRQVHEEDVPSTDADAGRQAPEEDAPPADADSGWQAHEEDVPSTDADAGWQVHEADSGWQAHEEDEPSTDADAGWQVHEADSGWQVDEEDVASTDADSGRQVHEEDEPSTDADPGWQAPEEDATPADPGSGWPETVWEEFEIDFSKPPPSDEEMGWAPSAAQPEQSAHPSDEEMGWAPSAAQPEQSAPPSDEEMGWAPSAAQPEQSAPLAAEGTITVVPSVDNRYMDLPADPLADSDISQLLGVPYTFVDSKALVTSMLDALPTFASDIPLLSLDLEGLNLGKTRGKTYLIQIYDSHSHHLYIVDVCTLRRRAFRTPSSDGQTTLKTVLQSSDIRKLFCDVRGDSYALFKGFRVRLQGIKDVQVIEIASRHDPFRRSRRNGLAALIRSHAGLSFEEMDKSLAYKESGRLVCRTWGYVQLGVRPLRTDLAVYAANDVRYLPNIYNHLVSHMSQERLDAADRETARSIHMTQQRDYDPDLPREEMTMANWHWDFADDDSDQGYDL